tara:strand:- start:6904 stop:10263 length:3360 start_codon:yes stop_codon:yes gene_type:complete
MDNLLKRLIEGSDDPKKPKMIKRKGKYTKKFNKWNKKMITENKLNVYYADPSLVYDRKTKKFSKKSIDKRYKEPTLKKKFQKMQLANQTSTENLINPTNNDYFMQSRNALINRNLDSIDLKKISMNDFLLIAMDAISNIANKEYYLTANIEGTPNHITLSEQNIKRLSSNFADDINDFTVKLGSDVEFVFNLSKSAVIKLTWKLRKPEDKPEGAFFKYYHNLSGFDLTKFGLFEDKPKQYENCLYTSLKQSGLSKEKLNSFISIMGGGIYIPCSKLNTICDKLAIHITIRTAREKDSKIVHYGNKELEPIKIGLMDKHFFLIEKTPFTNYSLKNYETLKDKKDWNRIIRYKKSDNCYEKTKDKFIDTFKLYKLLLENKETLLRRIPIQDILATQYHDAKIEDGALEYDETLCTDENILTKSKSDKHYCVFFDFETITEGDKHKPYLMCALTEDDKRISCFGEECGKNFLKQLANLCVKLGKEKVLLIAHNTRYDYTFLMDYLYANNPCLKGNRLMTGSAKIYSKDNDEIAIKFQDTLNFLVCPLSKFPKMFGIKNVVKEVIPYRLYTEKNVSERFVKIDKCLDILKNEKLFGKFGVKTYTKKHLDYFKDISKTFMDNAKKWNCVRGDMIDIIEYSKRYCDIDCDILKKSYFIFRGWMLSATKLDLKNYCSIASMSLDYLILNGVFKDCFKLAGTPQQFIQKCVVGGRVQLSNNEKKIRVGNIADFDAVAEYPSAMFRMEGILMGKPKVIKNKDINWLMNQDGFFIKVLCVNEPTKNRAFPCLSVIDQKTGSRNFTNKVMGETFYLDKTSYEDCVKFQGLQFEVLSGYYYDEGRNPKLKKVIKHLFDTRIKAKNEIKDGKPFKNPIEQVYKLLMNSCYGKCLLKPIPTEKIIKVNKDFEKYKARHFNYIHSYIDLKNSKLITQVKPINEHFNNVYAGVEILSMSKRILGEVLYCAEDNDIEIFYVDTDSTHIFNKDIDKLGKMFKKEYNRELLGEGMGQFNSDFDMAGCKEVHSTMFIGLGKKAYLDVLSGIDKVTGEIVNDYHIRMKGVSKVAIEDYGIINDCKYEDTYMKLYNDETLGFDLVARGRKCKFEYNPDMTVSSKSEFKRNIKFNTPKEQKQ